MRNAHPVFESLDKSTLLWRYLDLAKFCSLLQQKALYFSRADLMGDPLEGSFTNAIRVDRERLLANPPEGMTREHLGYVFRHNEGIHRALPKAAYINCWHLGSHESMAMWRGYGGDYGVAVQSTNGLLDELLPEKLDEWTPIFLGPVQYLNYDSEEERSKHENNVYGMFMCKSLPYRHEAEVRAIFTDIGGMSTEGQKSGILVPVNLEALITRVVVSPLAPSWFDEVIRNLVKTFGLRSEVIRSTALRQPVY